MVEDELWKFQTKLARADAAALTKTIFDSIYDTMNYVTSDGDID